MNNVIKQEPNQYIVKANKIAKMKMEITSADHELKIILEENAKLEFIASTTNNSSLSLLCELKGRDSSVDITNTAKAQKTDSQQIQTSVIHQAPNTESIVKSRGASWDEAYIDIKAIARVEKTAAGSVSRVECKALLLGEKSQARTDPILEILNNDVECSHAASIKEIDKKQIFYLQTRGLNEEQAKQLIVDGFLGEE
jgi:Fe-S cluster assembly protein SufB